MSLVASKIVIITIAAAFGLVLLAPGLLPTAAADPPVTAVCPKRILERYVDPGDAVPDTCIVSPDHCWSIHC